jgi:hypothetical protein
VISPTTAWLVTQQAKPAPRVLLGRLGRTRTAATAFGGQCPVLGRAEILEPKQESEALRIDALAPRSLALIALTVCVRLARFYYANHEPYH